MRTARATQRLVCEGFLSWAGTFVFVERIKKSARREFPAGPRVALLPVPNVDIRGHAKKHTVSLSPLPACGRSACCDGHWRRRAGESDAILRATRVIGLP